MTTSKQQKTENLAAKNTKPTLVGKNTKDSNVKQQVEPLVLEVNSEPLTDINFGF